MLLSLDAITFLALLFFIVAFLYASVGLGGGSSYTALMAIFNVSALAIPLVSLTLNLLVTTVGAFNFIRNRHAQWKLILPFLVSSMPMAWLGGSLQLPKTVFYWLLLISLVFVVLRIYFWRHTSFNLDLGFVQKIVLSIIAGSILGLIAGIVGIGGGIYLVPLIIILGLGNEKQAATCGAIFVWANSLVGLASRLQFNSVNLQDYLPLVYAVIIGGFLGSWLGASRFTPNHLEKILGLIVIIAISLLFKKLFF